VRFPSATRLEAFSRAGARLVFFDALRDSRLPRCDDCSSAAASPTHAARLAANEALRRDIREAIAGGLSTYAECGGLM